MTPKALVALCLCAGGAAASGRKIVTVPEWAPFTDYSHAVVGNGVVYVSGMVGYNMTTKEDCASGPSNDDSGGDEGMQNQTRCMFENLARVLEVAGSSMDDVLSCSIQIAYGTCAFVSVIDDMWKEYFPKDPPAQTSFTPYPVMKLPWHCDENHDVYQMLTCQALVSS